MARKYASERNAEYEIASLIASRLASAEGLTPGSDAWGRRAAEVYDEARRVIESQGARESAIL